jgi:ParB-like chromosome segregation protein Spo0J
MPNPKPHPRSSSNEKWIPIEQLVPWPGNPRKHEDPDLRILAKLLKKYGQTKPVIVQRGTDRIIAGHGTTLAAKSLKWKEIRVYYVDMDDETAKGYLIADNASALNSEWDSPLLKDLLLDINYSDLDIEELGLTDVTIDALFGVEGEDLNLDQTMESSVSAGLSILQWGTNKKVPVNEEEQEKLDKLLTSYSEENGAIYGFATLIINLFEKNVR